MPRAPQASYEWFREARYGMFIHYGLYSVLGRHEWVMHYERIPVDEYRELTGRFRPDPDAAREWARLARACGMRYLCLTTRHHEGFALFETAASDYSLPQTLGRDLVAEYVAACRAEGLGVGLYYSVADWSDPGFIAGPVRDPAGWARFVDIAHTQLQELMTSYGRVDYLFYDGCPPPETWGAAALNAKLRDLQPQVLISSRCGLDEDVQSAEAHVIADPGTTWECCDMTNSSWGFNYGDRAWKSAFQLTLTLLICAHNGGNLLLNVGPEATGSIPEPAAERLRDIGAWLERNGEAIYGTDAHPFNYQDCRLSTGRGNTAYVGFHHYHGPETTIAGIGNEVRSVRVLGTGQAVAFRQEGERLFLPGLPEAAPDGPPCAIPHPLQDKSKFGPAPA